MIIAKNIRRIKLIFKVLYYWTLCILLNPKGSGLDPYSKSQFKLWLTRIIPGNKNSAVRLLIHGSVINVGFNSWLVRDSKINGLECLAINRGKNVLEAVLIGPSAKIEIVIQNAWKGPQKARVKKIRTFWFNKPLAAVYNIKNDSQVEQLAWFKKTEELILRTIEYLGLVMKKPNIFEASGDFNNAGELARAAENRDLFIARFSNASYIVSPDKTLGFQQSQSSRVSTITRSLTDNKQLTKEHLARHNIPVPDGKSFTEFPEARAYQSTCNKPLVIKPIEGSYGKGITMGIRNELELETAWHYSKKYHDQVIMEEMVHGVDIRILVIGGKSKAALLRIPAHVVGDGKQSIESLIDCKNSERMANPRLCKAPIITDINTESFLKRMGYTLDYIPKKNEVVFLHFKANIGAGADSVVITDFIHQDLQRLAEEAASTFGVEDFWGIDMLVERIDLPRDKQKCCVIEVNSRANIFNVRFPLYGQPYDAAQDLVDYLFPAKKKRHPEPLKDLRIIVTGFFDDIFFDWVCEQAGLLNIRSSIKDLTNSAEIVASGSIKNLYRFIYYLWEGDELLDAAIDKLKIESYDGKTQHEFFIIKGYTDKTELSYRKKGNYNFDNETVNIYDYSDHSRSLNSNLDTQLFIEEFKRLSYKAKPLYEELLEIYKPGFTGITGMRFSSLFCDEVCQKLFPARVILSFKGIPVIRGIRFKPNEIKKGYYYFNRLNQSCLFNALYKGGIKSYNITNRKDFLTEWQKAISGGCRHIIVEEQKEGWNLCLAVVAGRVAGALLIKPIEVVGNGHSQIAELINKKNALRRQNPYYKNRLIDFDKKLLERLKLLGLQPHSIPSAEEKIYLESCSGLELGGETVNFFELLHDSFKTEAAKVVKAIPGLKYALVHMIIPYPDQISTGQNWAIKKIDTRPTAAMFHFPFKGKPQNLVQTVIENLCLANTIQVIRG